MTAHDLCLESRPRQRKTMAHAHDLLGRVAVGSITEEALAANHSPCITQRRTATITASVMAHQGLHTPVMASSDTRELGTVARTLAVSPEPWPELCVT
jgi:hypothetical protein